jgi:hypothetical protein
MHQKMMHQGFTKQHVPPEEDNILVVVELAGSSTNSHTAVERSAYPVVAVSHFLLAGEIEHKFSHSRTVQFMWLLFHSFCLNEYNMLDRRRRISMHMSGLNAVRDLPTSCTTNSQIESNTEPVTLLCFIYCLAGRNRISIILHAITHSYVTNNTVYYTKQGRADCCHIIPTYAFYPVHTIYHDVLLLTADSLAFRWWCEVFQQLLQ